MKLHLVIAIAVALTTSLAAQTSVPLTTPQEPTVELLSGDDLAPDASSKKSGPNETSTPASSGTSLPDGVVTGAGPESLSSTEEASVEPGSIFNELSSPEHTEQFALTVDIGECNPSASDVQIVDSVDDLLAINDPAIRIFCLQPGDYRDAGTLSISASGNPSNPRILRHISDWSGPIRTAVQQPVAERVIVSKILMRQASHWVIDGISVMNTDPSPLLSNRSLDLVSGSSDNVVSRSLIEGGRIAVQIFGSHRNTLQDNVVRETISTSGDSNCINIVGDPYQSVEGNRIVGNEVYNCTDSLQLVTLTESHGNLTFPGTLVANNDFYLTDSWYTNCAGVVDPNGECSLAEGTFDIKGGGTGSEPGQMVRVVGNRLWGSRQTDPTLSGSVSWGGAINITSGEGVGYVTIEDNIIMSSDRGITIGATNTHSVTVHGNVVYDIGSGNENSGQALLDLSKTANTRWIGNTVIDSAQWGVFLGKNQTISCNTIVDSPGSYIAGIADIGGNYYFGDARPPAQAPSHPANIIMANTEQSGNVDMCFTRKRFTKPELFCIPHAQTTEASPHNTVCAN